MEIGDREVSLRCLLSLLLSASPLQSPSSRMLQSRLPPQFPVASVSPGKGGIRNEASQRTCLFEQEGFFNNGVKSTSLGPRVVG